MEKIHKLIELYKEDSSYYDDFDDDKINEILNKLNESLSSLNEHNTQTYTQTINEFKSSLQNKEEKEILNDFLTYCKYYNK